MKMDEGSLHGTHFRCIGEGPPIVLIHGVGADMEMWSPLAKQLSGGHRVIAYDMQGHGRSAKPPAPYRLADFVRQLRQLADALSLESFDLLGFSMGGLVAQGFTLAYPACVARLILVNTVYSRSPDERRAVLARVANATSGDYGADVEAAIARWFTVSFRAAHPELIEPIRRRMMANDRAAYIAAYTVFATADEELAPQLEKIDVPALVITGADDQRSTRDMATRLASLLPRGTLRLLPDQRHMTPIEVPDRIAELVNEFLAAFAPATQQHVGIEKI